jgi:hypothetical protein
MQMTGRVGIWIDQQNAIAVSITDNGQEVLHFAAGDPKPFPATKETVATHSYRPNDFRPEDRIERKEEAARKKMYDAVIASFPELQALLILGPGEAKKEFARHIATQKRLSNVIVEIETSDKMSEPQLVSLVRQHFAAAHKES